MPSPPTLDPDLSQALGLHCVCAPAQTNAANQPPPSSPAGEVGMHRTQIEKRKTDKTKENQYLIFFFRFLSLQSFPA
jgi:hypothetical protein